MPMAIFTGDFRTAWSRWCPGRKVRTSAAVTSVKIEGVAHEFTTLKGVREDVTDIILNLKETLFKVEHDKTYTVRIDKQGEGTVTAADITLVDGVTCLNPNHKICTLSKDGKLAMELTIATGRGYAPAERHSAEEIDKAVVRGPLVVRPKPVWFYDNDKSAAVGERGKARHIARIAYHAVE